LRDEELTREQLIGELGALRAELAALRAEREAADPVSESSIRRSLMRNVELFRALFEQASDSIFLLEIAEEGKSPVIVDANQAACRSHGYEKHELVGQPITLLDNPEAARHIPMRMERLMMGKQIFFEGAHRRKDGSEFPVEVSAQMVEVGGRRFVLGMDRDISQHKAAEEGLRSKARKLRESNQKLQGVVYLASHELHAPLITVVRALDALMQKAGASLGMEERGFLRSAKTSAEGMLSSVRELISISRHSDSPSPSFLRALENMEQKEERV